MQRNKTFTILSCFAILLVLFGHVDLGVMTIGGLFPYYSYPAMIFLFIAGYFYKPEDEKQILKYFKKKTLHLLLPFYGLNIVYGLITMCLSKSGFSLGYLSLYNLVVAPFMGNHQFMLSAPAWFVPALFLLEMCNILGRKLLSLIKVNNEYVITVLYLIMGVAVVWLAERGSVYDWYKLPGRIMFMAPVLQFGRLYKDKLEKYDKLNSFAYFAILLILNLILCKTQNTLTFSTVWVTGFANNPIIPYVTTVTGIALWLRCAKLLERWIGDNKFVTFMGGHTFSIMYNHLLSFFLINSLLYMLKQKAGMCTDFDIEKYFTDVYYAYTPGGVAAFKMIYVTVGVALPLTFSFLFDKIKKERIKK